MSVASPVREKLKSLGKILAWYTRCFVENALSVMILHCLSQFCAFKKKINLVCKGRIYCEKWGKKGLERVYFLIPKRNEGS